MNQITELINNLSAREKRELLAKLLTKEGGAAKEYPLSFAQERLWFLDQFEPGNPAYNVPLSLALPFAVDAPALERAINEVVRRHEALRTSFELRSGSPVQVVTEKVSVPLPVTDLRQAGGAWEKNELARQAMLEEARRPFDLGRAPLVRARLLRLGEADYALLLTMHHIVSDAWSAGILVRELSALYSAFLRGEASPLAELPVQYADFARWQRGWLSGQVLEEQVGYWRGRLGGAPPVLELPADRPRPPVQSFRGASQSVVIPSEIGEGLERLSQREGATLFMTLLAAFDVLLYRYTGQTDILVGTPIAGRTRSEWEGLIGFFVNTLVLRADVGGDPTFRELVGRAREAALGAYAHQDLPFEKLVEELQPERDLSRNPLFQVMFSFQNAPTMERGAADRPPAGQPSDTSSAPQDAPPIIGTAKFDLTLTMAQTPQGLLAGVEYSTDLFEDATIARMLGHLRTLLEGVVADPGQRVSRLPILTGPERRTILVEWNSTRRDHGPARCLHELFEAQVERTPDAAAAIYEGRQLTYSELNRRANQLAHHLRRTGVGPDAPVAICMERSLEVVVAILGVLKAGGAYVPLDPAYPQERLSFMLQDSGAGILLTQERFAHSLPLYEGEVIQLDAQWDRIAAESAENPAAVADPENLAYMIYTSGSTGRPKGVMIPHRAIGNRLRWMQRELPITESDRLLQKTPISFDASVWEFFVPLLAGAQVVLARPGGQQDPAYMVRTLAEQKITILQLVPSMLQVLLQEPGVERCHSLRRVYCGGEVLSYDLQERFFATLGAELHNLYGPTEASIDVAHWTCERGSRRRVVPIGRAIDNVQLYILDRAFEPAPVGVSGELYLGGVNLARGYLGRPDLTAERFIPDPFSPEPGARLYRTGDLARYLADGTVEYIGRTDHQIKLRGYRIELGEIEAALVEHEAVRESVVVARGGPRGPRLVAYVVGDGARAPEAVELRAYLRGRLPDYMLPSAFVALDALPLTANGKLDRAALPDPSGAAGESAAYVEPRTPVEAAVAGIWAEVLGAARVGVTENFFELGGHSLLATQVVSRVRDLFGVELPLRAIFEDPTVAGLCKRLVGDPAVRPKVEKAAALLVDLARLSDDEVKEMIAGGDSSPEEDVTR